QQRGKCIVRIVQPAQRPAYAHLFAAALEHAERASVFAERTDLPVALRLAAEAFYRCPAALGQGLLYGLLRAVGNNQPVTGDGADMVGKLPLNPRNAGDDVRVIVAQVVDDQRARTEMHEFGALVEERPVVLIGFDNEERAFAKLGRAAMVDRSAT